MPVENESLVSRIQSGDKDLILELWSNNQPLIKQVVKRFECPEYPEEIDQKGNKSRNSDLMQESYLCLVESLPDYDQDKGRFINFYLQRLKWHLIRVISTNKGVSVPVWFTTLQNRYSRYIQDYYQIHGCYPDDETVIEALKINYKTLKAIKGINISVRSLNVPAGGSDDDTELWEVLEDKEATALDDCVTDALHKEELGQVWGICKDHTTKREYQALELRYREGQTIADTAERMGVSVQRVNVLSETSFDKLRKCAKLQELADIDTGAARKYYLGGFSRYRNALDTSCVEMIAVDRVSKQKRKRKPKQEDIKALEQELIDFFGDVI